MDWECKTVGRCRHSERAKCLVCFKIADERVEAISGANYALEQLGHVLRQMLAANTYFISTSGDGQNRADLILASVRELVPEVADELRQAEKACEVLQQEP